MAALGEKLAAMPLRARFSVRTLLLTFTAIGIAFGFWSATRRFDVVASVRLTSPVSVRAADIFDPNAESCGMSPPPRRKGYVDARLAVLSRMRDPFFLERVVKTPAVSELPSVKLDTDPVLRLLDDFEISLADDGMVDLRLKDNSAYSAADDLAILSGLVELYEKESEAERTDDGYPRVLPTVRIAQPSTIDR